jgi:putative ABC transport system permease protein
VLELRSALRSLRRSPTFAAAAILMLALGIGANVAVFSLLDALMLRPLPVEHPQELVLVAPEELTSYREYELLRDRLPAFSALAVSFPVDRSNLMVNGPTGSPSSQPEPGTLCIGLVSANYFSTLGVKTAIGRTFLPDEDVSGGGHPVTIISHAYWTRRFQQSPDVLSRTVRLNGVTYAIVGVAAKGFTGELVGTATSIWVPFSMASQVMPEIPGGARRLPARIIGRLRSDMTIEQARAASDPVIRRGIAELGGANTTESMKHLAEMPLPLESLERGYSQRRDALRQPLTILMIGVALLLMVGCANLASLMLSRGAERRAEMALRRAIGANRSRLIRQLLFESSLIALPGCALALPVAIWAANAVALMAAVTPAGLGFQNASVLLEPRLDLRTAGMATALGILAALLSGIVPAIAESATAPLDALNAGSARLAGGGWRSRPTKLLVAVQIALSLMLLIGAGLFLRTLENLRSQPLGFEPDRLLLVWAVPGQTGRQDTALGALWDTIVERLHSVPGVVHVGASNYPVLHGFQFEPGDTGTVQLRVEGEPEKPTTLESARSFITPHFFAALGVPLNAGREFTDRDDATAPSVVIINEAAARFYFGRSDPIGRRVYFWWRAAPFEVVGVVNDFARGTPRDAGQPEFVTFFPYRDRESVGGGLSRLRTMVIAVRTQGDPAALADRIRGELRDIDPELPIIHVSTADDQLADVLAQDRLLASVSSFFGAAAVMLACMGVFAVLSYGVARRTAEIGVRMAVGATRADVIRLIVSESIAPLAGGVLLGVLLALAASRLVAARLYQVAPNDPATIGGAIAIIATVALLAAYLPARRASSIPPMFALRSE